MGTLLLLSRRRLVGLVLPLPLRSKDLRYALKNPLYPRMPLTSRIDVKKGLQANLNFRLGSPFRPFEQLMGVLPDRSKKIVPEPYHVSKI